MNGAAVLWHYRSRSSRTRLRRPPRGADRRWKVLSAGVIAVLGSA